MATLVVGSRIYQDRPNWRDEYPDGIGLDMLPGEGVDIVCDLDQLTPDKQLRGLFNSFDHIDCTSVMEHTRRPWVVATNLEELLQSGGSIFLSVPFIWRYHSYPGDFWRFTHEAVPVLFPNIVWHNISYRYGDRELQPNPEPPIEVDKDLQRWVKDKRLLPRGEVIAHGTKR